MLVKKESGSIMPDNCIYCGRAADTRDHVPPKCFFTPPLPQNMITVPACRDCNAGFNRHETRVRSVIVGLAATESHPTVRGDLLGRFERSLHRGEHGRQLFEDLTNLMVMAEVRTPSGVVLGQAPAFNLDHPWFDEFFDRLVRGLAHHELSCGHLSSAETEWKKVENMGGLSQAVQRLPVAPRRGAAGSEFEYVFFTEDSIGSSMWIVRFFRGPVFKILLRADRGVST